MRALEKFLVRGALKSQVCCWKWETGLDWHATRSKGVMGYQGKAAQFAIPIEHEAFAKTPQLSLQMHFILPVVETEKVLRDAYNPPVPLTVPCALAERGARTWVRQV